MDEDVVIEAPAGSEEPWVPEETLVPRADLTSSETWFLLPKDFYQTLDSVYLKTFGTDAFARWKLQFPRPPNVTLPQGLSSNAQVELSAGLTMLWSVQEHFIENVLDIYISEPVPTDRGTAAVINTLQTADNKRLARFLTKKLVEFTSTADWKPEYALYQIRERVQDYATAFAPKAALRFQHINGRVRGLRDRAMVQTVVDSYVSQWVSQTSEWIKRQ